MLLESTEYPDYLISSPGINIGIRPSVQLKGAGTAGFYFVHTGFPAAAASSQLVAKTSGFYVVTAGSSTAPGLPMGPTIEDLGFADTSTNKDQVQGAIDLIFTSAFHLERVTCANLTHGVCVGLDGSGGGNYTQYGTIVSLWSLNTKFGVQTTNQTSAITILGGLIQCVDSSGANQIGGTIGFDLGKTHAPGGTSGEWHIYGTQVNDCVDAASLFDMGQSVIDIKAELQGTYIGADNGITIDGTSPPNSGSQNNRIGGELVKLKQGVILTSAAQGTQIVGASFLGNYCDLGLPNGIPSNALILTQQALTKSVSSGSDCTSAQYGSGAISSTGAYGIGGSIDLTAISLREDWVTLTSGGPYGTLNWQKSQISSNASNPSAVNPGLPDPIMLEIATDASSAHGQSISLADSSFGALTSVAGWIARARFRLPQASTDKTNGTAMRLGFGTVTSGVMATGLYLRFDTTVPDTFLTFVTRDATGTSVQATTVLDSNLHTLTISSGVAGEITFQLDSTATVCFTNASSGGCVGANTIIHTAHVQLNSTALNWIEQDIAGSPNTVKLDLGAFGFYMSGLSR